MEPKIFFTDLDGTLLNSEKIITEQTKTAVLKLVEAKNYLAFVTGRPLDSLLEVRAKLNIPNTRLFYVAYNGGIIIDAEKDEVIYENRLSLEQTAYVLNLANEHGIYCHAYTDHDIVARHPAKELDYYRRAIHLPVIYNEDILSELTKAPFKCLAIELDDVQRLEAFRQSLLPWAQSQQIELLYSNQNYLEIFPANNGKGQAVEKLCELLHVPVPYTMAAGDQENDITMLKAAGFGVCLSNGVPAAKAAADAVTLEDNDHDGLVPFLANFFL